MHVEVARCFLDRVACRVIGGLFQLFAKLGALHVLRDVERALVGRALHGLLPALANLGVGHQTELFERGRQHAEVAIGK